MVNHAMCPVTGTEENSEWEGVARTRYVLQEGVL